MVRSLQGTRGVAALATALGALAGASHGQVVYEQDFNAATVGSSTVGPGGFVQLGDIGGSAWQVQGGGGAGGVLLTAGIDANGVGGSRALFANWDHTPAAPGFFTFNQYTVYGLAGPAAGTPLNRVQVSMDLFISGSEGSNTPINVIYQDNGGALGRSFTPTLANGAFTNVTFTLDQASNSATTALGANFNLRVEHGAGGFGFDADNVVRIDNARVRVVDVPEPAAALAASAVGLGGLLRRRRAARRS